MRKSEVTFAKLTPEQARVKIAKDVIAQINAKYFIVTRGQYVALDEALSEDDLEKPLGELVKQNKCSVCALGAMFMTSIKGDKKYLAGHIVDVDDEYYDAESVEVSRVYLTDRLSSLFSQDQMDLIENCFEGRLVRGCSGGGVADSYQLKYSEPDKALTSICKNIIRNNGTFIPEQDVSAAVAKV